MNQIVDNRLLIIGGLLAALFVAVISLFVSTSVHSIALIGSILFIFASPWYLKNPHIILYLTVAFIPLGVLAVVVPGMTAVPLLALFLLILCIPHLLIGTINIPQQRTVYWLLGILALLIIFSALIGVNFKQSMNYLKSILQMMGFSFLVICLMNTKQKLNWLWWVVVVSCFFAALITLMAKFNLLPFSLNALTYGDLGVERQTGTDGDPNYFAVQLSVGLTFSISSLMYMKNNWIRLILFPMILVLLWAISLTLSIGAIIGLFGICFYHIVSTHLISASRKILILFLLFISFLVVLFLPVMQTRIEDQVQRTKNYGVWQLGSYRVLTWTAGSNIIIHHPIFGVGIGNHAFLTKEYDIFQVIKFGLDADTKPAHNMYISFAADNGIPALIVLLLLIIYVIKNLRVLEKKYLSDKVLFNSILSALICYLIQNVFLDGWRGKYLWLLIGMGVALISICRIEVETNQKKRDLE